VRHAAERRSAGLREEGCVTISELGALGEFFGSILTLVTLAYLAMQIRQNTAQQKREELISVQHGQNSVIAQLRDPQVFGGYVRAASGRNPSVEDWGRAFSWVAQYLNHFQVVHELHRSGAMGEEQYQLWAGYAVSIIAPPGMRRWWDEENGRLAFHSDVREMIDQRLEDRDNPPVPLTELWSFFGPDAWESVSGRSES
jgi:hypothetical protein